MRGLRHPYLWGRNHPWMVDTGIAVGLCLFGWVTMATTPLDGADVRAPTTWAYVLNVVGTLPLLVRRRHPVVVFAVTWVATVLFTIGMFPGGGPVLGALFAVYACAAHARRRGTGLVAVELAAVSCLGFLAVPDLDTGISELIAMYAFLATAWVLGDNMRIRRQYVATVEERADRLERERDIEAERAVLGERARIARELHDVVAHGMSVMVVQAGAARRTLAGSPELAAEAIGHIESTGRSALEEMRRLVSVLRASTDATDEHDAPLLPQPQAGDLDRLVAGCRDAGLDVSLAVGGEQHDLPPGLGLVVYRVVQEALTNTIRHAGPATAAVCLEYEADTVVVAVTDDGRGAAAPSNGDSVPGHGLAGMRERVSLYGGSLSAGPQAGGGFRVVARLPIPHEELAVPGGRR